MTAALILSMTRAVQPCREDDLIQLLQYGPSKLEYPRPLAALDSPVFPGGPAQSELSGANNVAIIWHLI